MVFESYQNASGSIAIDYIKGYICEENTNKIQCHPFFEFILLKEGRVTYTDPDGVTKVTDKSLILTKAQEIHNPHTDTAHLYERYRIAFYPEFVRELYQEDISIEDFIGVSYKKPLTDTDFTELWIYFKGIYEVLKNREQNELLQNGVKLVSALIKGSLLTPQRQEVEPSYISDVITYIKENYQARLTAENIASRFFVSRGKLMYDFKAYANMSLLEYITVTRIEAAKELLSAGYSVVSVAERCGFSSSSYFIKVFSGITNMTPLKFQIKFYRR